MEQEMLTLLRENNAMLKRVCQRLDKIESAEWQTNEDMKQLAINLCANKASEFIDRNRNNNQQTFWR